MRYKIEQAGHAWGKGGGGVVVKDSLLNSEKNTVQKAGVIKAKNTFVATFKYCACSSSSKPNNCKIYFVSSVPIF